MRENYLRGCDSLNAMKVIVKMRTKEAGSSQQADTSRAASQSVILILSVVSIASDDTGSTSDNRVAPSCDSVVPV